MQDVIETSTRSISVAHPDFNLVLTRLRPTDGEAVIAALNDPRVYMNLFGPPYPYTQADWQEWYSSNSAASNEAWEELESTREWLKTTSNPSEDWKEKKWVGRRQWNSTIRHVTESADDRDEKFIGDVSIARSGFLHVLDPQEREKQKTENEEREAGDPAIVWEVGCKCIERFTNFIHLQLYRSVQSSRNNRSKISAHRATVHLVAEYHARGVMVAVLRTLMTEIAVPYMNVHILIGTYFEHNRASRRVFEKCGFTHVTTVPDAIEINPAKIGGAEGHKVGLGLTKWARGDPMFNL